MATSGKNGIHCQAISDNLTKLFQEYSMSGLLLALCFLLTAYFDRLSWQLKIKKGKNARNPMKVILICCHGNQNVNNNCIFCYQQHKVSDWEFVDVYLLFTCRNLMTNVIAILSQSSAELCARGPLVFCFFLMGEGRVCRRDLLAFF